MINEMVVRAARGDQILGLTPRWIILLVVDDYPLTTGHNDNNVFIVCLCVFILYPALLENKKKLDHHQKHGKSFSFSYNQCPNLSNKGCPFT
jgi:hypothetical protein